MTCSAFLIIYIPIFSDNFPVYFRKRCATPQSLHETAKHSEIFCFSHKKDPAGTPFYKVFN